MRMLSDSGLRWWLAKYWNRDHEIPGLGEVQGELELLPGLQRARLEVHQHGVKTHGREGGMATSGNGHPLHLAHLHHAVLADRPMQLGNTCNRGVDAGQRVVFQALIAQLEIHRGGWRARRQLLCPRVDDRQLASLVHRWLGEGRGGEQCKQAGGREAFHRERPGVGRQRVFSQNPGVTGRYYWAGRNL